LFSQATKSIISS